MNLLDRIMMPALLLASLYVLVDSCIADWKSGATHVWGLTDHPATAQWMLLVVALVYLLYQAVRIGSPLLTFTTGVLVLVGCFGSVVVKNTLSNVTWRNVFWAPIWENPMSPGNAFIAAVATLLLVAAVWFPVMATTFVAWIVHRKRRNAITELAIQMLRESNKVDAGKLARGFGISETDARACLAESRRRGTFPFKADIV